MTNWLVCAVRRDVVWRATKVAIVVGTLLMAINHGDAVLAGALTGDRLVRIALTYFVPYAVSTFSSVGAILDSRGSH